MATVTIDESPEESDLTAYIKIDDVVAVKCTSHWVDKLTNNYSSSDVDDMEAAIIDHVENSMGYEMIPQLETDIRDAIAYVGTLG